MNMIGLNEKREMQQDVILHTTQRLALLEPSFKQLAQQEVSSLDDPSNAAYRCLHLTQPQRCILTLHSSPGTRVTYLNIHTVPWPQLGEPRKKAIQDPDWSYQRTGRLCFGERCILKADDGVGFINDFRKAVELVLGGL